MGKIKKKSCLTNCKAPGGYIKDGGGSVGCSSVYSNRKINFVEKSIYNVIKSKK